MILRSMFLLLCSSLIIAGPKFDPLKSLYEPVITCDNLSNTSPSLFSSDEGFEIFLSKDGAKQIIDLKEGSSKIISTRFIYSNLKKVKDANPLPGMPKSESVSRTAFSLNDVELEFHMVSKEILELEPSGAKLHTVTVRFSGKGMIDIASNFELKGSNEKKGENGVVTFGDTGATKKLKCTFNQIVGSVTDTLLFK